MYPAVEPSTVMAKKFAILVNADTDQVGAAANVLEYAIDLDDNDHEVVVYFDGSATQWNDELEDNPDNPVNDYYEEVRERDLIGGACGYCANAFGVADEVETEDIELLGGRTDHGPHVGGLVDQGYELLTIG